MIDRETLTNGPLLQSTTSPWSGGFENTGYGGAAALFLYERLVGPGLSLMERQFFFVFKTPRQVDLIPNA